MPIIEAARFLTETYLAFLGHAFSRDTGRFRTRMAYDRRWVEDAESEDSHGRALWALGMVAGRSDNTSLRGVAAGLFSMALPAAVEATSPRGWAFTLIGIYEYMRRFHGDHTARTIRRTLAHRLTEMYRRNSSPDWPWFEDTLTYANARLPQAMILTGRWIESKEMVEMGLHALGWLADLQRAEDGCFSPIGSHDFYARGGNRARFDQQPVEAAAMVSACLEAYRLTSEEHWRAEARRAFDWFLGQNDVKLPVYDPSSGGCRDALHPDRTSANQGAESDRLFPPVAGANAHYRTDVEPERTGCGRGGGYGCGPLRPCAVPGSFLQGTLSRYSTDLHLNASWSIRGQAESTPRVLCYCPGTPIVR